jgi:hypothetical protein
MGSGGYKPKLIRKLQQNEKLKNHDPDFCVGPAAYKGA